MQRVRVENGEVVSSNGTLYIQPLNCPAQRYAEVTESEIVPILDIAKIPHTSSGKPLCGINISNCPYFQSLNYYGNACYAYCNFNPRIISGIPAREAIRSKRLARRAQVTRYRRFMRGVTGFSRFIENSDVNEDSLLAEYTDLPITAVWWEDLSEDGKGSLDMDYIRTVLGEQHLLSMPVKKIQVALLDDDGELRVDEVEASTGVYFAYIDEANYQDIRNAVEEHAEESIEKGDYLQDESGNVFFVQMVYESIPEGIGRINTINGELDMDVNPPGSKLKTIVFDLVDVYEDLKSGKLKKIDDTTGRRELEQTIFMHKEDFDTEEESRRLELIKELEEKDLDKMPIEPRQDIVRVPFDYKDPEDVRKKWLGED